MLVLPIFLGLSIQSFSATSLDKFKR